MRDTDFLGAGDPGAIEALFAAALTDAEPQPCSFRIAARDAGEQRLVDAYRNRGHLKARLDPLELCPPAGVEALDPRSCGLDPCRVQDLVGGLERCYCCSIGWDIGHVTNARERLWLEQEAETPAQLRDDECLAILSCLARVQTLEEALHGKMPEARLFSVAGAETFIVALEEILACSVRAGVAQVVIGGMHRGRFALLAHIAGKPLTALVAEIKGASPLPPGVQAAGDVSYHLGFSGKRMVGGRSVHISVSSHPSHLQIVPLVALGKAWAKQRASGPRGRAAVLPLLVHTDAGFSGQGIMAEMMQISKLAPFDTGGAIHVVINNQIGFTTEPGEARSARYCTDIAKLAEVPVLHVNGDDPEAVLRAARTAGRFRAEFQRDIVIDIVCYRRHGHNELDEPRFTQPAMYRAIDWRAAVGVRYRAALAERGLDVAEADAERERMRLDCDAAFQAASGWRANASHGFGGTWAGLRAAQPDDLVATCDTGVDLDLLRHLGAGLTALPDSFDAHPKIRRFLHERGRSIRSGEGIDWATAEALAFASLLAEGTPVRFSGQDSVRGAFSQRHLVLHDQQTGARQLVLRQAAATSGAPAYIHNTPLMEYAILAFEYGISLAAPDTLVAWEAQFGDFLNIAQPVIDQFVACGEDRWLRASGLVILAPHGLDGGGPDHSTARPERLIGLGAGANIQVVNPSTPANFFHVLRRQMRRPFRVPLVVLTPKALLRNRACVSSLRNFGPGTGFRPVIPDDAVPRSRRIVVASGKICYELAEARAKRGVEREIALVRLEQLHPLPEEALSAALAGGRDAELVWCEEEPENMGAFKLLDRQLEVIAGRRFKRAGRPASATPATGIKDQHKGELEIVINKALS